MGLRDLKKKPWPKPVLEDDPVAPPVPVQPRRNPHSTTVTTRKTITLDQWARRGLNAHFIEVLDKHHPDASLEEVADALGGDLTFGGEIVFDD